MNKKCYMLTKKILTKPVYFFIEFNEEIFTETEFVEILSIAMPDAKIDQYKKEFTNTRKIETFISPMTILLDTDYKKINPTLIKKLLTLWKKNEAIIKYYQEYINALEQLVNDI